MKKLDGQALGWIILIIIIIWVLANPHAVSHALDTLSAIGK